MSTTKCGMITICGRPNVGKSTLLNRLVGEKIAIVSHKAQTTRNRICGIVTRDDCQYIFVDTPGLLKPKNKLGEYMLGVVNESVVDTDVILLLVEPIANVGKPEQILIDRIRNSDIPAVLCINKIDTVNKQDLLSVIAAYTEVCSFSEVLPISAAKGEGTAELMEILRSYLPEGPMLFPEDMITDQPERQLCAEIVREKLLRCLDKEVPHGTAVEITQFHTREDGVVEIAATIYCEKESHKGIIIGKHGAMLKKIATQAREDMERFLGNKVYLQTWVKVRENWRDDLSAISNFGYREE